jgi:DNA repair photolyase
VLVYTGSVFHAGGANQTQEPRIGMNLTYCLNWLRQEENQYLSCPPEIARTLEPRAPAPRKRLAAVKALREAGIPAWVSIAPVVPGLTDHEHEHIGEAAAEAGAIGCFYLPVRLPFEVAPLFRAWLDEHFPDRAGKVMAIIQSLRGGKDNDPNWFSRMRGQGPWADLLRTRFERAIRKHGLNVEKRPLRRDLFRPPEGAQLSLL